MYGENEVPMLQKGEHMFVDKETKSLAELLATKLRAMTGNEELHPLQIQWLSDVSELLDQLS
jgi:hypothetical protein